MLNDGRSDAFVSQGELNRPIAGIEFEDGPDRDAYLLAQHVSGITGNTQSTEPFAVRQSTRSRSFTLSTINSQLPRETAIARQAQPAK